jgi:hypothetical protein
MHVGSHAVLARERAPEATASTHTLLTQTLLMQMHKVSVHSTSPADRLDQFVAFVGCSRTAFE